MPQIGHTPDTFNFHSSNFVNVPFYSVELSGDILQQAVPVGMFMIQPELVVRKTFLEPVADIRQVEQEYKYEGTWVAANLHISLPTPETHPDFPAWKVGMTPEEVYDLFWPAGWHFCSPPGKPTATGRFGPVERRFWRHEFRQEDWNEKTMDADELLWEHLTPMITRSQDSQGRRFGQAVTFPRDCIETLRCRPFTFAHKVVNKWHHKKSVLIGDAAHVFPPFGGQGIASGIRDAHQLAWRIAALEKQPQHSDILCQTMLDAWAAERTKGIQDAATFTKMNGMLCNNRKPLIFPVLQAMEWFTQNFLGTHSFNDAQAKAEQRGFQGVKGGFFLNDHEGGCKLPQIYVDSLSSRKALSDTIFEANDSPLRLLSLQQGTKAPSTSINELKTLLSDASIPEYLLSPTSIIAMSTSPCPPESIGSFAAPEIRKISPTPLNDLTHGQARRSYDVAAFQQRLGKDTRYAIVRPDFYVFATARNLGELRVCLEGLRKMVEGTGKVRSSL
ncbi:hypothetical protein M409DRAFT_66681 [Zasmidium cellare ATCC 36951]|uniref:FAD-binding domain-containing protein n=1 Tax=Zasmidium cellare ATCC 36951 TaxID=1080233 RepID=A0A6A6CJN9_ZASCE|nr:uncharacterized protein M409DRAFT_66681 [Zasmidium cellare ATCC 36951]KAF2166172.1 hypothetical protein M409DRAFT_66681 [Zasmidium cellare ATCC 36951]